MAATIFDNLDGKKLVIGLVHLPPLPGTPLYEEGNLERMMDKALHDCKALYNGGADGALLQPINVIYPSTDDTDYACVAAVSAVASRLRAQFGAEFHLGIQLLWNCITPSLAACKATGADFTRCTALSASSDSPYGRIEANPLRVADYRVKIGAQRIGMISEVSGYHAMGGYDKARIQSLATNAMKLGANALEVMHADEAINEQLVLDIKALGDYPVILGGATNVENCKKRLRYADGALVGTAFEDGHWGGPVVESIVAQYVARVRELERELRGTSA